MISRVIFRPAAEADLQDAYDWYEQCRPALGFAFIQQVDSCLKKIRSHPQMYPIVRNDIRCAPTRRFPYTMLYFTTANEIVVLAVFHAARDPRIWQRRS